MSSELSIGNEIKDGYKETHKWVVNNIRWLSELEAFYRDRAKLEKEYSSKLTHLTGEYFSKKSAGTVGLSVGDTPTTTPGSLEAASLVAWNEILSQTEKMSQDHNQLAQEFEFQVADQVSALGKKCELLLSAINGFNTELADKRDSSYSALDKAKKDYDEKCVNMESARAKQTKSSSDKAQRKAGEKEHDMNIAKNNYLIKINQANRIKDKFYFQDIPEVLDLLQDLSESRVRVLNSIWFSAGSVERDMCKRIENRLSTADSVVEQNKSNLDTTMFIKHNLKDWKEPADFQYIPSPVWHDDEQFVATSEAELQDLRIRLAKSQQTYDKMHSFASAEMEDLGALNKQRHNVRSKDEYSGQELLALLTKYSRTITSYTSHETAKLEAEVEIESIQNNVGGQHDLNTDTVDLNKLGKKGGVFNRFKKTLTISSEKKGTRVDKSDQSSLASAASKEKHGHHLSFLRGRSRAQSNVSGVSLTAESDLDSGTGFPEVDTNRVLYAYQAQDVDEVSVNVGDTITLLTADSGSGWTKIANESTGDTGLVPTTYVDIREKSAAIAPPAPRPRKNAPASRVVSALYDYVAQEDGELSISEGDKVTILKDDDGSGWTYGELRGVKGLFPTSYAD
ncbi:LADA_0D07272g1_1 [Lachancea dasiensis]|uniref:Protein BZZ1 n=1 Tax=Lachancea dasiensis TaxID=1072105 RepID=A0A1G4J6B4_9SACH|nr:LADA_0D07272g1_1 [Lachancea dasiensis]